MKIGLLTGTVLLAVVAALTANAPGERQASATKNSETISQEAAKQSSTVSRGASAPATADKRKIPCKTPENAALCYWTHGRLSVWEGSTPFRIWKIGTHRLLGVHNGPSHDPPRSESDIFNPEFPANLDRAYGAESRRFHRANGIDRAIPPPVFADFEVCPLEPEHRGWMQHVCIESARNIFIEKDY